MDKVLGIGNALVDIMTTMKNDNLLNKLSYPKGSMQLVSAEEIKKVLEDANDLEKTMTSGGSAANTVHGLANLGVGTGYIGKIGNDEYGDFFKNDLIKNHITPTLLTGKSPSGRAVALISPDHDRTFATYLGAAIELGANDLASHQFSDYDYLHLEGYLVQNHELLERAAQLAKQNNISVSLDLASFNVVEANLTFLKTFIKTYVDIVFANEEEAKSLTGKEPREALDDIAGMTEIAVVKIGKQGSLVKNKEEVSTIGAMPAKVVDTTGAGDLYAAGFLYGLLKGYSMKKCGEIGSIAAGKVIEVTGAKLEPSKWKAIGKLIHEL
ncbi:MAG: adenosine kinase [Bacteroidales bacterium]|nr:adenosine kinase [Bacteroidales bacterium]